MTLHLEAVWHQILFVDLSFGTSLGGIIAPGTSITADSTSYALNV